MVGVAGKYKGCNTCRARRVKCDNTRPFCKKCTDYGRECGGYERDMVFIVGTQDERGRVGSHPPRQTQSPRSPCSRAGTPSGGDKPRVVAIDSLRPAWDETMLLNLGTGPRPFRIIAQHANLESALPSTSPSPAGDGLSLSLLDVSQLLDITPTFRQDAFRLKCQCLIHVPETPMDSGDESLCLFLYRQNSSAGYDDEMVGEGQAATADTVREMGPVAFQRSPAHHFFARVYRPSAVMAALLNRQPIFLCHPEWTVIPWDVQPRTSLDDLLDILVMLPSLFSQADPVVVEDSTVESRMTATELLSNSMDIERQFAIWYSVLQQSFPNGLFWENTPGTNQGPGPGPLAFTSPLLCLVHIYYWAALISFHQCICGLVEASEDDGGEGFSRTTSAGVDRRKYEPTQTRALAMMVCRSIVQQFYEDFDGGCEAERQWIDDFRGRLNTKKGEMSTWLQERRWVRIERFE